MVNLWIIIILPLSASFLAVAGRSNPPRTSLIRSTKAIKLPVNGTNTRGLNFPDKLVYKLGDIMHDWLVKYVKWNPMQVENEIMKILCAANIPGNYGNPTNCNRFLMCDNKIPFLAWCPWGGSYNPLIDSCLYTVTAVPQCPYRSIWGRLDRPPVCEYIGERPFWGALTLPDPIERNVRCGRRIMYCQGYYTVGRAKCPEGYGFCKAVFACLPLEICRATDEFFNMP